MHTALLDTVHDYWFGPLTGPLDFPEPKVPLWFGNDPAKDAEIARRFGGAIEEAAAEAWDLSLLTPSQRVALIVLLDQFPRNVHRGTPQVYRYDGLARELAYAVLGFPLEGLTPIEMMFVTLPLGHSESLADQDMALAVLEEKILPRAPEHPFWNGVRRQAHLYRDIIARFGRFPHRNGVLGRETTPEESAFMAENQPASG